MTDLSAPYIVTGTDQPDALTLFNEARARSLDMADALIRTLDVLFAENAAIRAELDELRRTPERQPWKDRREAAAYLSCSTSKIDDLVVRGLLTRHKLDAKSLYHVDDLDAVLAVEQPCVDEEAA